MVTKLTTVIFCIFLIYFHFNLLLNAKKQSLIKSDVSIICHESQGHIKL